MTSRASDLDYSQEAAQLIQALASVAGVEAQVQRVLTELAMEHDVSTALMVCGYALRTTFAEHMTPTAPGEKSDVTIPRTA